MTFFFKKRKKTRFFETWELLSFWKRFEIDIPGHWDPLSKTPRIRSFLPQDLPIVKNQDFSDFRVLEEKALMLISGLST
jgi:hypothetical protein